MPIDTEYYLTNQLSKPLSRLFEVSPTTYIRTAVLGIVQLERFLKGDEKYWDINILERYRFVCSHIFIETPLPGFTGCISGKIATNTVSAFVSVFQIIDLFALARRFSSRVCTFS